MYTLNGNKLKFESQFRCFIERSSTVSIQSIKEDEMSLHRIVDHYVGHPF